MKWWFLLGVIISRVVMPSSNQLIQKWGHAAEFFRIFVPAITGALFAVFFTAVIRRFINPSAEKLPEQPTNTLSLQSEATPLHECQNSSTGSADIDRDLYVKRAAKSGNTIDYQILGNDKAKLWAARCNVAGGNVRSLQLFSDALYGDCLLQVTEEIPQQKYAVKDRQTTIGSISVANQHWEYYNTNHTLVHAATLKTITEERDELWAWLSVIFINRTDSPPLKSKYVLFTDSNGTTRGKYSFDLNNIDLTQDTDNRFDLRIAAVFAMLADNSTVKKSA